jgi:hypothetical protein
MVTDAKTLSARVRNRGYKAAYTGSVAPEETRAMLHEEYAMLHCVWVAGFKNRYWDTINEMTDKLEGASVRETRPERRWQMALMQRLINEGLLRRIRSEGTVVLTSAGEARMKSLAGVKV